MKIAAWIVCSGLFMALYAWVLVAINTTVGEPPSPLETPEAKARIEKRMRYHGLSGVVILRESQRGLEFERDGKWCKL